MKYEDPNLLDSLAAEYAIGTLRGAARRRFERVLSESAEAREAVAVWEGLLGGLGAMLPGVAPPERVWKRIERRIEPERSKRLWSSLPFWRGWGLATSSLVLVLTAALLWIEPADVPAGRVAVFADQQDQPMWVITANAETGTLRARAVNAEAAAADRAYELWMLPAEGPPRSLGLLPVGREVARHDIPPALRALLGSAQGLAISLEPAGGSPTGQPTGPVLYQASMLEL